MTLHPINEWIIPAETVRVVRAAFPKGNVYMMMGDQLGQVYHDKDFQTLFRADCGQSALSAGQLALITIMQFAEGLTDPQTAIRQLNRIECCGETLRRVLNDLATVAPSWLLTQVTPDWFDRYGIRFEQYRLPKAKAEQQQLAVSIGEDGHHLLSALYQEQTPFWLKQIPSVEILRQVWVQQYYLQGEQLIWRQQTDLPPNKQLIESPYDPDARNRTKRDTNWTGYAVHLTETCDQDTPNLIINVETTPATTHDGVLTQKIHQSLALKDLLPAEHLMDTAYVDAQHLVSSQSNYEIDLIGPVSPDVSWQASAQQGFDISCFGVDWEAQRVVCPAGKHSQAWRLRQDEYGNQVIEVRFNRHDCATCASRQQCTRAQTEPRLLKLRPQKQHEALQAARTRLATAEFKQRYAKRAGVEGTLSQGTRRFELRRSRYIGLAKTHLQHIATAAAMNLTRLISWLSGVPQAKTRTSPFFALAPTA